MMTSSMNLDIHAAISSVCPKIFFLPKLEVEQVVLERARIIRAFGFRLGSGSGFAKFGIKLVGLKKFVHGLWLSCRSIVLGHRACSGLQKARGLFSNRA